MSKKFHLEILAPIEARAEGHVQSFTTYVLYSLFS